MMHDSTYTQEKFCGELFRTFDTGMWKWDERFGCVLVEFSVRDQDIVRAVLKRYLINTWDSSTIDTAPETVQRINGHFGGLMAGQILFASGPDHDDILYCAWWPWGDGETISIRVAPFYRKISELEQTRRTSMFKVWFGITM